VPLRGESTIHDSRFDKGLGSWLWLMIWTTLVNVITLGIAYPWTMCAVYGWRINNQVVDGHHLCFDGTGAELFGNWIIWWFLTLITFGIYALWIPIKIIQWQSKHTFLPQLQGSLQQAHDTGYATAAQQHQAMVANIAAATQNAAAIATT
jgi:uncharacterized membrane protein YjgN (DUF898 family)